LYFLKVIAAEESDFSQKTFDFEEPALSYGLKISYYYPKLSWRTEFTAYQYEYIFNDYWLDYKQNGIEWQNRGELLYNFVWLFDLEWFQRDYILKIPQSNSCSTQGLNDSIEATPPVSCAR